MFEHQATFGNLPHAQAHQAVRWQTRHHLPQHVHLTTRDVSVVQIEQAGDCADECGFARAIGPQQGHDAALRDLQADIF